MATPLPVANELMKPATGSKVVKLKPIILGYTSEKGASRVLRRRCWLCEPSSRRRVLLPKQVWREDGSVKSAELLTSSGGQFLRVREIWGQDSKAPWSTCYVLTGMTGGSTLPKGITFSARPERLTL